MVRPIYIPNSVQGFPFLSTSSPTLVIYCLFYSSHTNPGSSGSKESAYSAGDLSSVPGLGRSLGGGHGYPLQYSCLENPTDRGAWWATVHGLATSQTQLHLNLTAPTPAFHRAGFFCRYRKNAFFLWINSVQTEISSLGN